MRSQGLLRARGQLAFIVGLALASGFLLWLGRQESVPAADVAPAVPLFVSPPEAATELWAYVERNRDATTGLVNAREQSGWTTPADVGHAIRATLAAHQLRLISGRELWARNAALLRTLGALTPGPAGQRIDTRSGHAADDGGQDADPAPLLSALELLAWSYPANGREAAAQLERWRDVAATPCAGEPAAAESDLARTASALVRLALSRRGDHR